MINHYKLMQLLQLRARQSHSLDEMILSNRRRRRPARARHPVAQLASPCVISEAWGLRAVALSSCMREMWMRSGACIARRCLIKQLVMRALRCVSPQGSQPQFGAISDLSLPIVVCPQSYYGMSRARVTVWG